MTEYKVLAAGGFTKGADIKAYSELMNTRDPRELVQARELATAEQMAVFKPAAGRSHALTVEDAEGVGILVKNGYDTPEKVRELTSAVYKPGSMFTEFTAR